MKNASFGPSNESLQPSATFIQDEPKRYSTCKMEGQKIVVFNIKKKLFKVVLHCQFFCFWDNL